MGIGAPLGRPGIRGKIVTVTAERPTPHSNYTDDDTVEETLRHLRHLREMAADALRRGAVSQALLALQSAERIEAKLAQLIGVPLTDEPPRRRHESGEYPSNR